MSYARMGDDSDVYVYSTGYSLICQWCWGGNRDFYSTADMLTHLDEHRAAGERVPDRCYEGLREDQAENDQKMREGGST
jgi:hypothetical protein